MIQETPAQRIARELEEALNAGKGYGLIDAIDALVSAASTLCRRHGGSGVPAEGGEG